MSGVEYQKTTIVFPRSKKGVLLGMKKRGFGEGWWNGFGGKLEDNESYEGSARRETLEEAGIKLSKLVHIANLSFYFDDVLGVVSRVYSANFNGNPKETEEMRPQLFPKEEMPFDTMWPADRIWIPKALAANTIPLGFIIHFDGNKSFKSLDEVAPEQLESWF